METKTLNAPDIHCGHCVMTIQNEVSELKGVKKVVGNKDTRTVTVEWAEPATWEQIQALLTEIDYPPTN